MTCGAGLALLGRGSVEITAPACELDPYYSSPVGDPHWASVGVQIHAEGADGATSLTNSATGGPSMAATGSAALTIAQKKFGATSIGITGTPGRFECASWSGCQLGAGDFTVEFWFYLPTDTPSSDGRILSLGAWGGAGSWMVDKDNTQGITFLDGTSGIAAASGAYVAQDTWVHVAVCRSGSAVAIYINGASRATGTCSTNFNASGDFRIGTHPTAGAFRPYYVDDLRITPGVCRYTGDFLPPTATFPDVYGVTGLGRTVLLLHGESYTDSSTFARAGTAAAGVSIDTTEKVFGASAYRNTAFTIGRIDYPASPDFNLVQVFTLEFWIYIDVYPASSCFVMGDAGNKYISMGASGNLGFTNMGAGGSNPIPLATWTHIAYTRDSSNVCRSFQNGVLIGTASNSAVYANSPGWAILGLYTRTDLEHFRGRIDEFRWTQDVCRYTSDFSLPTVPFCGADVPVVTPPPTTVPPETYVDLLWSSVRFLSAMDLTKVNDKTSVAYTQDSAAVTATDPFDGAGALACVYPPESPTSTPFSPVELATLTLRGASGSCVEMWVRLDAWATWTSGAYKWANLVQQDDLGGDPAWAVGIADELVDGVVTPCLQLFSHYIDRRSYLEIRRRLQRGATFPVDGQWHHLAVDFRYYSGFVTTIVVYLDGAAVAALSAPDYTAGQILQFAGQTAFDIVEGTGIYTVPAGLTSTTFDGALDEIRITEASRYPSNFTVPHYAFPRS